MANFDYHGRSLLNKPDLKPYFSLLTASPPSSNRPLAALSGKVVSPRVVSISGAEGRTCASYKVATTQQTRQKFIANIVHTEVAIDLFPVA